MKKVMVGVAGIILLIGLGRVITLKIQTPNSNSNQKVILGSKATPGSDSGQARMTQIPSPYSLFHIPSRSIFIPYWSQKLSENDLKYDNYYYFGVRPTGEGKLEDEVGLSNMPKVVESLKSKVESQKKLVLRMLDPTVNEAILSSQKAQDTLSEEIISFLNDTEFSGIIVDLEIPFTLQEEKKGQITQFVQQICTAIKADYKTCDVLVYGDYSYRGRPYDLKALGQAADKIILMAYDFHKAGGEPGPNFPLVHRSENEGGSSTTDYGYDFKQMVADAVTVVPKEKIEVVFGMYGYDWTLNEQGKPLKSAEALSLNSLKLKAERLKLDPRSMFQVHSNVAKEKSIQYIDSDDRNHIIWYEDEESAEVKIKYLQERGILQVSFWAQSYF